MYDCVCDYIYMYSHAKTKSDIDSPHQPEFIHQIHFIHNFTEHELKVDAVQVIALHRAVRDDIRCTRLLLNNGALAEHISIPCDLIFDV